MIEREVVAAVPGVPLQDVLVAAAVLQRHVFQGQTVGDAGAEVRRVRGDARIADDEGLAFAGADEGHVIRKVTRPDRAERGLAGRRSVADVEGTRGDHDGVAGLRRAHRGVDRGIAAVADEQEVVAAAVADFLDAGERVGALAAAGRHDEMAEAVVRDHRGSDRSDVGRGVGSAAADDGVAAAAAGEDVVPAVADDGVIASAAGGVLDVDQHVGADVDAFRDAHCRMRVIGRHGGAQKVADRGSAERRVVEAVDGVEIDRDRVRRRRIGDGIGADTAVIDVVAAALSADDVVVAAAGLHDVVAAAGVDGIAAIAGNDEVGAVAGGDMGAAGAAERDRGRHVVRNGEVEVLVGGHRDVD